MNTQIHKMSISQSSSNLTRQKLKFGSCQNGRETSSSFHHSASTISMKDCQKVNDVYSSPIETHHSQQHSEHDQAVKTNKKTIMIFHCEFSSERGPGLLRFLRNQDRSLNANSYPNLYYPELYLLEGGYKSFYETFKAYCDPQTYKPMHHSEHTHDLKHFRAKAKSWEANRHNYLIKCNKENAHFRKNVLPGIPKSDQH